MYVYIYICMYKTSTIFLNLAGKNLILCQSYWFY